MTALTRFGALALFLLGSTQCGGVAISPAADTNDGGVTTTTDLGAPGREPKSHRASEPACASPRPAGVRANVPAGPRNECASDADCTKGLNGRCNSFSSQFGEDGAACTYDQCTKDADCGGTFGTCTCSGTSGNYCVQDGDCRVDADCAGGKGFCSLSFGGNACNGSEKGAYGYYCHTPADECSDDSDCRDTNPSEDVAAACVRSTQSGKWVCTTTCAARP